MEIPAEVIRLLHSDGRVATLTGAGISQESGLRTFRDAQMGLWSQYRSEDLATPEAFRRNPKLVWEWYAMRRERVAAAAPNPGHYALAQMARRMPHFTLITQNVDGLHARAGNPNVIELHGNLSRVRCFDGCGVVEKWKDAPQGVPCCPQCGAYLRPDVVWFGEQLPLDALQAALDAARSCDLFLSIGTSGLIQPAASLAYAAKHRGAMLVEVNTESTPLTPKVDFFLQGRSGEILPELVREIWG